ncbi:MAG: DEAD/DEAH box helicase [Flavobacterium sp.]
MSWESLNLNEDLSRGIYRFGFEKPTPIQEKAIPPIIEGRDIIAQGQSGTGKTGSFTIGALQKVNIASKTTQALILAPTFELVKQISSVVSALSSAMDGLVVKTLVGGTSVSDDSSDLRNNCPHVVVGTAGRVYDMIRRKCLLTDNIKIFILDEADEMLSKGFKEQMYDIFKFLNDNVQVALFSATMPEEMLTLSDKFMRDPVKIVMKTEELTLECIQQYYIALSDDQSKYEALKDLFSFLQVSQCIIYVGTVKRVEDLYNTMTSDGFPVCCIHSAMDKSERDKSLQNFRKGAFRVMVSSGVTARGIDVQQVSTVINFDMTRSYETYLHAIGRSGRFGRKGLAINFITKHDIDFMRRLEKHYNITIDELPAEFDKLI